MTVTVGAVGSRFPLHVEAGKRYLIDAQGQPFFIQGESAWALIVQLTREQADQYLEDRRLKGVNTVMVQLVTHGLGTTPASFDPPKNVYGVAPFTVPGDFSTPNETYFAHAEYVISKAAEKGMLVLLAPAYMGYQGGFQGWYADMVANGEAKLRTYGQYVANRFRAYDNIVWLQGGDYDPPNKAILRAVPNGTRDIDTRWLHTFHGGRGTSALGFLGNAEPWLTVNDIYTDENTVVANAFLEYGRSTMPFFLIEARYENEGAGTEVVVRTQAYQTALSGGTGHVTGNNPIWYFGTGWQTALSSRASITLPHLRSLIDSLAWWTLLPDTNNTFLTAGAGAGVSRAVAARASTGSFALAYTPSVRALTFNLAQLAGPNVRARWYDPTNGSYVTVAGSPFPASGSQVFTPTGNNSSGFGDWALVLDSTP